jgi:putative endonuclease
MGTMKILNSMYYVYILHSPKKDDFYTGFTADLVKRVAQHNAGKNKSTSYRIPLELIYYEAYLLKGDALAREKYLKTSDGKRDLKRQLKHYYIERKGK